MPWRGRSPSHEQFVRSAVVDIRRGEQGNSAVAVLVVVPGKEAPAEGPSIFDAAEPGGNAGTVFKGLEAGFAIRSITRICAFQDPDRRESELVIPTAFWGRTIANRSF